MLLPLSLVNIAEILLLMDIVVHIVIAQNHKAEKGDQAMTEEHLTLYRSLSETKVYKERFGEWNHGDNLILRSGFKDIYCQDCTNYKLFSPHLYDDALWLPPVFDPENPERCLWVMVDWEKFTASPNDDRTIDIHERYDGDSDLSHWHCWNDRLDIALIKAILKQEEL